MQSVSAHEVTSLKYSVRTEKPVTYQKFHSCRTTGHSLTIFITATSQERNSICQYMYRVFQCPYENELPCSRASLIMQK